MARLTPQQQIQQDFAGYTVEQLKKEIKNFEKYHQDWYTPLPSGKYTNAQILTALKKMVSKVVTQTGTEQARHSNSGLAQSASSIIANTINSYRPAAQATVDVHTNKDGDTIYTLYFYDSDGKYLGVDLEGTDSFSTPGAISRPKLNAWINDSKAVEAAMQGDPGLISGKFSSGYGSGYGSGTAKRILPTNATLTDSDIEALKTTLPNQSNYKGLAIGENSNVAKNLFDSYDANSKLDTIARTSLEDLMANSDEFRDIITTKANQNITNKRQALLTQIQNDPELYNAVVSQLRNDAANNIIAGQRAANTAAQVAGVDNTYDELSENLLSELLGKTNVASNIRESVYGNRTAALDSYINARLSQAASDAAQRQTQADNLAQLLNLLGSASEVAANQYNADVAKATAQADIKAERKDLDSSAYAGGLNASDYTVSRMLDAIESNKMSNKQYEDIVNDPVALRLLTDEAYRRNTQRRSYADILNQYDLSDVLGNGTDDTQLYNIYRGFADEANKESNKVFNQAQRAYIASIAAGDATTAEQLSKLANTAGTTRGNLYAASNLSNQFNNQRKAYNTGKNLLDTYQQQLADNNLSNVNTKTNANNAFTGYMGNAYDAAGSATLSGVSKSFDTAGSTAQAAYANWANLAMKNKQDANTTAANAKLNDFIRINNLANKITNKNIDNAINNKS